MNPATLGVPSATVNPVTAGGISSGIAKLIGKAGTSGIVVSLVSDNGAVVVPASVTVLSGSSSASFAISTSPVASTTVANITLTANGSTQTLTITVNPAGITAV